MADVPLLPAIPWYRSPQTIGLLTTIVATVVALFPKAATLLGLTSPAAIKEAVENVAGVVTLVAAVAGFIVRKRSKIQPITLTQAAADAHPQSVLVAVPTLKPETVK